MAESGRIYESDIALLLVEHYKEGEMEQVFRLGLLDQTRRVIAGRRGRRSRRWVLGLAAGAAAAVVAAPLLWRLFTPSPVIAPPQTAVKPRPAAVAPGAVTRENQAAVRKPVAPTNTTTATSHAPKKVSLAAAAPGPERKSDLLVAVIAARPPVSDAAGHDLKIGDRLSVGAVVRTGKSGRLTLITRRGSEFTLDANTALALAEGGKTATLNQGRIYCRNRKGEFVAINTSAGRIQLLGTTLDAAMKGKQTVAVTVIEGKVRLENAHGKAVVGSGKKALLIAQLPPTEGESINTEAETAWYDGRGDVLSDFGDIVYTVSRAPSAMTEIWTMGTDGSNKRRVKTYIGFSMGNGPWLPGQQTILVRSGTALWSTPNFETRTANSSAGHPIVEDSATLLNVATGQEAAFQLPAGYDPLYMDISPDAKQLAFCGRYQPAPKNLESSVGGVWVYDIQTGDIKKVADGWIKTPVAWAPDSRHLAFSTGQDYGVSHSLVVVDVESGETTKLNMPGASASFSPDGTKLAYCGDFQKSGSWMMGVPTSGSIFVADLVSGGQPLRISPVGQGSLQPRWSPDGSRLAYWVSDSKWTEKKFYDGYRIYVVNADGTGTVEIYRKEPTTQRGGRLTAVSWAPTGQGIYVVKQDGVLLLSPDGSGVISNLGGSVTDSPLSRVQSAETDNAIAAVREAIFQYAVGEVRAFEGRPADSQAAFAAAADIFASLPWKYPLANLSTGDVLRYADKAEQMASRSVATILSESCKERLSFYLSSLLVDYAASEGRFPADLKSLETWSLAHDWGMNWISNEDTAWVKMIFQCPSGGSYNYTPPPAGSDPKTGDVLVTCPNHPDRQLVWEERLAGLLKWKRQIAERQKK